MLIILTLFSNIYEKIEFGYCFLYYIVFKFTEMLLLILLSNEKSI